MADVGVRPARQTDAEAVADIQVRAWRSDYGAFVPAAVLAELTGAAAREVWRQRWTEAVTAPPSPRHMLLVAVAGKTVVGFAACGPASDADHDPETTAEIITLRVDPDHDHDGHGSRLLAAAADLLRDHGFSTLITWLFEADEAQLALFVSAGWAPDGARRTLSFPSAGSGPPAESSPSSAEAQPAEVSPSSAGAQPAESSPSPAEAQPAAASATGAPAQAQATEATAPAAAAMVRLHTDITPGDDPAEELGRR